MTFGSSTKQRALLALLTLAFAVGCTSTSAGPAGGGAGGAAGSGAGGAAGSGAGGDACAPTAGAGAGVDPQTGCANAYVLPHYDGGDTCGLCDPGVSTQCSNATGCDWATSFPNIACSPDGTACAVFGAACSPGPIECGWGAGACSAQMDAAVAAAAHGIPGGPCASDRGCSSGHFCSVRVANRMFCDNTPFFYAKDYCTDAGTDSGTDAAATPSDAGTDAADASL